MLRGFFFVVLSALIVITVVFLRFYKLGKVPQGLNIDEASYGYEAYSLLITGRDSWNHSWPLTLTSFGDNKPAGLAYAAIPFVKLFGLSPLAVRLPTALSDLVTLIFLFLTLGLFSDKLLLNLGLTVLFALSPWDYSISRLFYETNLGLTFLAAGLYYLLRSFKTNHTPPIISLAFLALSGYFYAVFRYLSLMLVALYFFCPVRHKKGKSLLVYLLFIFPLLFLMFSPTGLRRLSQEGIERERGHQIEIAKARNTCYLSLKASPIFSKSCYVFWNLPLARVEGSFRTYLALLSPRYLFLEGTQKDILPFSQGPYFSYLAPFYLVGLAVLGYRLLKQHRLSQYLLLSYLGSAIPVAAAEQLMIHRHVLGLYLAYLIIAIGLTSTLTYLHEHLPRYLPFLSLVFVCTSFFAVTKYQWLYHTVYTKLTPEAFNYDAAELYHYVIAHQSDYDLVVDRAHDDGPLFFAFYSLYDPALYQTKAVKNPENVTGWVHNSRLENIQNGGSSVPELLCERHRVGDSYFSILVISEPVGEFAPYTVFATEPFTREYHLHELYDIGKLYDQLQAIDFDFESYCQTILK